jgi:flavin reductase (DIM6/NTAB) family NADH-FMN oxidoreductase RutF
VPGALCRIDCVVQELHPGGDHVIVLGRIVAVDRRVGAPLLFHGGRFGLLEVDASSPAMDLWDSLSTGWF